LPTDPLGDKQTSESLPRGSCHPPDDDTFEILFFGIHSSSGIGSMRPHDSSGVIHRSNPLPSALKPILFGVRLHLQPQSGIVILIRSTTSPSLSKDQCYHPKPSSGETMNECLFKWPNRRLTRDERDDWLDKRDHG